MADRATGRVCQGWRTASVGAQPLGEGVDSLQRVGILGHALRGTAAGVDHGGVVAAPNSRPMAGRLASVSSRDEVHGELAGPGDARGARGGAQLVDGDAEVVADRGLDVGDRARPGRPAVGIEAGEDLVDERRVDRAPAQRVVGDDADEGALQGADALGDGGCDALERRLVGEVDVVGVRRACAGRSCGWRGRAARRRRPARTRSGPAGGPRGRRCRAASGLRSARAGHRTRRPG